MGPARLRELLSAAPQGASADFGLTLLEYGAEYLFVLDGAEQVISCNGHAHAVFFGGHDPGTPTLPELVHGDDYGNLSFQSTAEEGAQRLSPWRMRAADGTWRWLSGSRVALPQHAGPGQVVLTAHDITALKRAEQEQQELGGLLRQLIHGRPLELLLKRIVQSVDEQLPGHFCAVLLGQGDLRLAAAPGAPPGFVSLFSPWTDGDPYLPRPDAAPLLTAQATPTALAGALRLQHIHEVTSMPLIGQQCLGWLALYRSGSGELPDSTMALLSHARQLATVAAEQHLLTQQLDHQAHHDALTGLPNRRLFTERLGRALKTARLTGQPLTLLLLDLDHFKEINDSLGHPAGDQVLQRVARHLQVCLRPHDTLARLGGDEFAVLLPATDRAGAAGAARRLLDALPSPFVLGEQELYVSASIGIMMASGEHDAQTLFQYADVALYQAKVQRNHYAFFQPAMMEEARERQHLVSLLRRAAAQTPPEFELHYQPLVRLSGAEPLGAEALLRWSPPGLGPVSPAKFIPLAEDNGLIVSIGAWVLEQACRQAAAWPPEASPPLRRAVNVSAQQFAQPDFVATVERCLGESGLPPHRLELELTERVVMQDVAGSAARMGALRSLGVHLAIDDFGTGYSSLSYLAQLPLSTLKIDRAFVRDLHTSGAAMSVARSIIGLARTLGLSTVAEGIETPEQRRTLLALGCEYGQGYLFARPQPAEHLSWPAPEAGDNA